MPDQKAAETEKSKALDILFPTQKVPIGEGVEIEMRPISVADLSKVMGSFIRLAQLKASGLNEAELAILSMKEIVQMLPFCTDHPLEKIPHQAFPDLLAVFLEQNMTEDLVSKWMALAEKVKGRVPGGDGSVKSQSPKA